MKGCRRVASWREEGTQDGGIREAIKKRIIYGILPSRGVSWPNP